MAASVVTEGSECRAHIEVINMKTNFAIAIQPSQRSMFYSVSKPFSVLITVMALALVGCSGEKAEAPASVSADSSTARVADGPSKFMAYEHAIQVGVPEARKP